MQADYPPDFDREMAGTLQEWKARLPRAMGSVDWCWQGQSAVSARLSTGHAHIGWAPMPDRVIALMRLPRLFVQFRFEGVDDQTRLQFMKHFDLVMQRGGG